MKGEKEMKIIKEQIYPVDSSRKSWRGILDYELANSTYRKWFRGSSCAEVKKRIIEFVSSGGKGTVLYGDFVKNVFLPYKHITLKLSSYTRLYSIYVHHCCLLDSKRLCDITALDCLSIFDSMKQQNFSKSSLNKTYEFFNNSFNYAVQYEYLEKNPLFNVPKPRSNVAKKEIQTYSALDMEKFEAALDTVDLALYRYSVPFLYYTGLRIGELIALDKADFDFERRILKVRSSFTYTYDDELEHMVSFTSTPKTQKGYRVVPLNEPALYYAKKLFGLYKGSYFISSTVGTRIVPRNYSRMLQRLCEHCGVQYKGVHALRHSFATSLISKGASVKYVSELLGHASVQTTFNLYVHADLNDMRKVVDLLAMDSPKI